jgi:predicted RNA polymerase sigma factor
MSESATHAAIETVAQDSYGRPIAYLAARSGDVAGAEDALGDAFIAALRRWPAQGVPEKPEAWLLHVARNRMLTRLAESNCGKNLRRFYSKSRRKQPASHQHKNISPTND